MPVYIRKRGLGAFFMGYASPFQPVFGAAEWALPFASPQAAFAGTPSVIHPGIEVVGEAVRRSDARRGGRVRGTPEPTFGHAPGSDEASSDEPF